MKRFIALMVTVLSLSFSQAFAQDQPDHPERKSQDKPARPAARPVARPAKQARPEAPQAQAPAPQRQPVVINMSRPSSGGHDRNFPSQQRAPKAVNRQPSYGQIQWNQPAASAAQNRPVQVQPGRAPQSQPNRPSVQSYEKSGVRAAVAVHHHPYTQGYVRKKLQKMGVTAEPDLITDRSEFIHTDKAHSTVRYPKKGFDKSPLSAVAISPRHLNDEVVRDHMARVQADDWRQKMDGLDSTETQSNHYYWHNDTGFDYCHYVDDQGYQWYGWYLGDQFFWNRYFGDRWWWYDSDYDRWCFWNGGFWWWQDPYHVGDLYCYNDNNYIPCNSAEDQVVVTDSNDQDQRTYPSLDGTRLVKISSESQDAFLYDASAQPAFDPVYLASGVESVSFSDPKSGRPLEIVLKLNDGSYDMFDAQGNAYSPGAFDADQAAQTTQDDQAPQSDTSQSDAPPPETPPADSGADSN